MKIGREGLNIVTFEPEGDFEYEWLVLNTDAATYQWIGRTLAVDTSCAGDLLYGVGSAGFVVDFGDVGHGRAMLDHDDETRGY